MSSFFKTFWAALLAFVVANIILGLLSFIFFAAMVAALGSTKTTVVESESVLNITLSEPISDAPASNPFDGIDFRTFKNNASNSILQVISAIQTAMLDDRIKGIYLNLKDGNISTANMEELRATLIEFKESGKFIVSYNDTYSQRDYYLSSVADSVYVNPQGFLEWKGMSANVMFYKGLLDKLNIDVEIFRHGTFKSAVEPLILDKMSPENRLQYQTLVDTFWGEVVSDVAASRSLDSVKLQQYASTLELNSAEKALENKMVDGLLYDDQVKAVLNGLLAQDADDDINFISLPDYISATGTSSGGSKNRIEIIYADGDIIDGDSERGSVGGHTLAKKLAKARDNDRVKGVVLRVNSPGGSALASEIMWREVELLKAKKPVVVSMGGVAASGGYYISCPADVILCDRFTLTGSIGVFGVMFNLENALKDKLGITMDVVRTNPSADMLTPFRKTSDAERAFMMSHIEKIYTTFVEHVAAGRNLSFEQVDAIGGGRVWAGPDAKRIGLVDGFGGINDAIKLAADRADVAADYSVHEAVEIENPFEALMSSFTAVRMAGIRSELGEAFVYYNNLKTLIKEKGVQARMPYAIEIE